MTEQNLENENVSLNKKCMKNNKGIFWGLFLVTLGLLLLGRMFGLFHFYWFNVFKLWPLIIVWVGIRLLPIEQLWKNISSLILLAVAVVLLFVLPAKCCCHDFWHGKFCDKIEKAIDDVDSKFVVIEDIEDDIDIDIDDAKISVSVDSGVISINAEKKENGEKKVVVKKIKL